MTAVKLTVNGQVHTVDAEPDTPLLRVLRDVLGMVGAKYGCGVAQCGACTVHIDGVAIRPCVTSLARVGAKAVTTIEGIGASSVGAEVQEAWKNVGRQIVNPNGAEQQVQGSVLDGISLALGEEFTIENGAVTHSNFGDFPLLRFADAPDVEVHFVISDNPPTGLGEPALPPSPAALVNAIFAATGKRIRTLPVATNWLEAWP